MSITREEALLEIDFYRQKGTDYLKVKDVSMYSLINKIYDEHEAQLKAKDEHIKDLTECYELQKIALGIRKDAYEELGKLLMIKDKN